jgi:hemoglobin/transferrin/lactoferrin receptor protein
MSTGFRVPNIDDLAKVFESGPGKLIVPNEKIKPERTVSYEWGIEQSKVGRYSWDLHMFYTQFMDAIVTDLFSWQGQDSLMYEGTKSAVLANQNKRRAYICGVQGKWQANWSQDLKFILSGMYTYGRIKSEQGESPLDHIPPMVLRATWNYEKKVWGAELSIEYNGKKRRRNYMLNGEDNEQYATPEGMPAWVTANFRLRCKVGKYMILHSGIENIFDTQYRTFASGINAPGRNFFATIKITR